MKKKVLYKKEILELTGWTDQTFAKKVKSGLKIYRDPKDSRKVVCYEEDFNHFLSNFKSIEVNNG